MRGIVGIFALATTVAAFAPVTNQAVRSPLFRSSTSLNSATALNGAAIPNPFSQLPWNAKKQKEREARRLKQESAQLHRELGIAEDSTYEELTDATNRLILQAGSDVKKKIKIEMAKDRILQIRLNERLSGITTESKEARAQSTFEEDGADEVEMPKNKKKEWEAPQWTRGLVVKPDEAWTKKQAKRWGGFTLAGLIFPGALEYMGMFNWLMLIGQLTFRGINTDDMEGFGMFGRGAGGSHSKVAWLLGISIWGASKALIYTILPLRFQGLKWTPAVVFSAENAIYFLSSCYLQPYKG